MQRCEWEEREIARLSKDNPPAPDNCPACKGELKVAPGMVGEDVLYCPEHGMVWEDVAGAIRRVI